MPLTLHGGSLQIDVPMRAKLGVSVQCHMFIKPDTQGATFKSPTNELLDIAERFDATIGTHANITGTYNPLVSIEPQGRYRQVRMKTFNNYATEAAVDSFPTPLVDLAVDPVSKKALDWRLAPETTVDVKWWSRDDKSSGATLCLKHMVVELSRG